MMVNKMTLQIYEVIKKAASQSKKADKIKVLKENESFALRTILQGAYDSRIQFILPEGTPPYTPNEPHAVPSTLHKQVKRFAMFVNPKATQIKDYKRESMFIQLLEGIHPEDAKIVLQMKDKKPFKGISSAVVKEAFPSILP